MLEDQSRSHADDEAVAEDGPDEGGDLLQDAVGQKGNDRPQQQWQGDGQPVLEGEPFLGGEKDREAGGDLGAENVGQYAADDDGGDEADLVDGGGREGQQGQKGRRREQGETRGAAAGCDDPRAEGEVDGADDAEKTGQGVGQAGDSRDRG